MGDAFKQCYILSSGDIDFIIEDICIILFLNLFTYKTNQMYHYFFYNVWIKILYYMTLVELFSSTESSNASSDHHVLI